MGAVASLAHLAGRDVRLDDDVTDRIDESVAPAPASIAKRPSTPRPAPTEAPAPPLSGADRGLDAPAAPVAEALGAGRRAPGLQCTAER
ncbi:hypothetical protein LP52_02195 [Streptomonospora alba]|uniref:Uncharacterized protein n=1 Tax=Streptomonospora alba TaxID=183763 RepID=A0A0C2JTX7_9ACTN|nr:hypothetical protein LP52_02195 [Streptomonospora alba]